MWTTEEEGGSWWRESNKDSSSSDSSSAHFLFGVPPIRQVDNPTNRRFIRHVTPCPDSDTSHVSGALFSDLMVCVDSPCMCFSWKKIWERERERGWGGGIEWQWNWWRSSSAIIKIGVGENEKTKEMRGGGEFAGRNPTRNELGIADQLMK